MTRTDKTAGMTSFNRFLLLLLIFMFSIGGWDAKVAKTGKTVRVASFNRVLRFAVR